MAKKRSTNETPKDLGLVIGRPYYVLWLDACFSWEEPAESCSLCQTLGWFVKEDDRGLVFSMEKGVEEDGGDETRFHMSIPHAMVVDVVEIPV